jgi:hypothetical protein
LNGLNQDGTKNSRIERLVTQEGFAVLCVSGRLKGQQVEALRELLGQEKGEVMIDLKHVLLVDDEAVRLLAVCESKGLELRNCPAYIGESVNREIARPRRLLSDVKAEAKEDIEDA